MATGSEKNFKSLATMRDQLKAAWNGGVNADLAKIGGLLSKAKEALINVKFLPGSTSGSTKEELCLVRDILEIGAFWSIGNKDTASFEKYMAQLKPYYLDFKTVIPGDSAFKFELLALNLMYLLSHNRVAEFHTEVELLAFPDPGILKNDHIKHAVEVEQWLMEGRYNKIFQAKRPDPAGYKYNFFIDILFESVRDQIAECIEKSYGSLKPESAAKFLNVTGPQVQIIAQKRGWMLNSDGSFVFKSTKKEVEQVASYELAKNFIEYAKELDRIV